MMQAILQKVFETINMSTYLAKRVRSFEVTNCDSVLSRYDEQELRKSFQNMTLSQINISYGSKLRNESVDLSFFTLSTAPIQKLAIDCSHLYSASLQLLASIFPSLTHLNLKLIPRYGRERVSEPFLFIYQ